jgi:hypothetical protein
MLSILKMCFCDHLAQLALYSKHYKAHTLSICQVAWLMDHDGTKVHKTEKTEKMLCGCKDRLLT